MNGANNSTIFVDASIYARTISATGNTRISTAQSRFGGASGYFDGTGDVLGAADAAELTMAGDFTVEWWMRADTFAATAGNANRTIFVFADSFSSTTPGVLLATNGNPIYFDGTNLRTGSAAFAINTWYYCALRRSGSTMSLWTDGAQLTSWTDSAIIDPTLIRIGGSISDNTGNYQGYLDDFRITAGVARDVSVVPTSPFPTG
nr:LamG-like jellyroll fold domain-containing protein [Leptolyngbya sp. FACHB-60]